MMTEAQMYLMACTHIHTHFLLAANTACIQPDQGSPGCMSDAVPQDTFLLQLEKSLICSMLLMLV